MHHKKSSPKKKNDILEDCYIFSKIISRSDVSIKQNTATNQYSSLRKIHLSRVFLVWSYLRAFNRKVQCRKIIGRVLNYSD